jgi:hypothetical protein
MCAVHINASVCVCVCWWLVCRDEPGWLVATLTPKEGAVGPDYRSAAVPTSERAAAMVRAATPPMWGCMACMHAMHGCCHAHAEPMQQAAAATEAPAAAACGAAGSSGSGRPAARKVGLHHVRLHQQLGIAAQAAGARQARQGRQGGRGWEGRG